MAERFEAPDEVKAEYNRQVLGAKSGMDNRSRILDASLFWKLMAVLKGFQRKQEQEGIVWVTTLDSLIPELLEATTLEEYQSCEQEIEQRVREEGWVDVIQWLKEYAIHSGKVELNSVLADIEAHSPFYKPYKDNLKGGQGQ